MNIIAFSIPGILAVAAFVLAVMAHIRLDDIDRRK